MTVQDLPSQLPNEGAFQPLTAFKRDNEFVMMTYWDLVITHAPPGGLDNINIVTC